jgi:hypothetical protein
LILARMNTDASPPDTIVLVHGFWVTPRSWEDWITHYQGRGYRMIDYHNAAHAPLLFISGREDNLMPPKIQRSNAKHYEAPGTITQVKEFDGPHLLPARDGWEEVADYALSWATSHAATGGAGSPPA